jgi:PAS domain S-box-containing protein
MTIPAPTPEDSRDVDPRPAVGSDGAAAQQASASTSLESLTIALLDCVTPGAVVASVVERGVAVLRGEAGMVVLLREGSEAAYLEIVQAHGYADTLTDAWRRFPLAAALPLSDAVREQTAIFSTSRADLEARYPEMFRTGPIHPVKASVSLPLTARGQAIGGIHFSFPEERTFSEAERSFVTDLARQCALALDRALLLDAIEAARRRQEFLARASALLAESLDVRTTLDSIARLAVPDLCDWVTVDLVEDRPLADAAAPAILQLAVVAHSDPTEVAALEALRLRSPITMAQMEQPPVVAITTGKAVFVPDITPEMVEAAAASGMSDEQRHHALRLGIRSLVSVPLQPRSSTTGVAMGAITLVDTNTSGRTFTTDTVGLVEELARRAAVAIDNARLYEQAQREVAERADAERRAEQIADDLRLITDAAPMLISYVGPDLRYRYVNRAYSEWFSTPRECIIGRTLSEVIGEAAFEKVRAPVATALSGERASFENVLPYGEGKQPRLVHVDMVPDRDPRTGSVRGYVAVVVDLTERRRIERELAARNEEIATVFERVTDAFAAFDVDWNFTYVNSGAEQLIGMGHADLIGRCLWDLFPDGRNTTVHREFLRAQREQTSVAFEMFDEARHGWFEVRGYPSSSGLSAYFRNVTALKMAEEERTAAQAERRRAETLLDTIAEMFYSVDADFRITYANRRAREFWNRPADRLLGRNLWKEFPDVVGTESHQMLTLAMRERRAVSFEALSVVLGRWIECHAYPAEDSGLGIYFLDIHERKQAQEEVARREREYAAVAENADDVMVRFDADLCFLYANRAIERHIGVPPAAVVGRSLAELGFPEENLAMWSGAIRAVFRTGERQVIRFVYPSPTLGARWYEASITPEAAAAAPVPGTPARLETVIVVARDITESRAAEERLRQGEERLRLATAAANVGTWDFRPLTGELIADARCKELFGLPSDAGIDYGIFLSRLHADDRAGTDAAVRRALDPASGGEIAVEYRTVGANDAPLCWVAMRGQAFFREDGTAERFIGAVVDVTEAKERESERLALAQKQRRFLREMLLGFTEGRLHLCFSESELPAPLAPLSDPFELSAPVLRTLRDRVTAAAAELHLANDRLNDFLTAVHEAAMNAVRHAGGGTARIHGDPATGAIQVWVVDHGPGIAEDMIHRAVERGFTTGGFGQGFFYMQTCTDRLHLLTLDRRGTTVVLEQRHDAPAPAWFSTTGGGGAER